MFKSYRDVKQEDGREGRADMNRAMVAVEKITLVDVMDGERSERTTENREDREER